MSRIRDLLMAQSHIPEPLVHYDFSLYDNIDKPTSIPNLAGNDYKLNLKNINFKLMSGFGGYADDWTRYISGDSNKTDHTAKVSNSRANYAWFWGNSNFQPGETIPAQIVKVTGIDPNASYKLSYNNYTVNITFPCDGIYLLPKGEHTGSAAISGIGLHINNPNGEYINHVIVEQLPLYPGCFVASPTDNRNNSYLLSNNVNPTLFNLRKGFTIISQRSVESINDYSFLYHSGGSQIERLFEERLNTNLEKSFVISFGKQNVNIPTKYRGIVAFTSTLFNGTSINKGDVVQSQSLNIIIGNANNTFKGGMREFYLFNQNLTQSQIERFISENMIPDPLVYYDVRKQNTKNSDKINRGTLIDLSGNGNHGVLNNFDYIEDSGWVETYIDDEFNIIQNRNISYENHLISVTIPISTGTCFFNSSVLFSGGDKERVERGFQMKSYTIKVSGLGEGSFRLGYYYNRYFSLITIKSDGIYEIPSWINSKYESDYSLIPIYAVVNSEIPIGCTIEFLPRTDYLQFDGNNDNITIPTITKGFKTVLMISETQHNDNTNGVVRLYEQRKGTDKTFSLISYDVSHIAYNSLSSGETFINGALNTTIAGGLLKNHRICVAHRNNDVNADNSKSPVIGAGIADGNNGPFRISKFLGFSEYLSNTQIKKVIDKYGLMEGVSPVKDTLESKE